MQTYITPAPGRTPSKGNIVNRTDYKLDFNCVEFRPGEHVLTIDRFIPEHGWISQQYFLTESELKSIQQILNGTE
jgi:hypothetical protein